MDDVRNFDKIFTKETPEDAPVDSELTPEQKEENFYEGFEYVDWSHV